MDDAPSEDNLKQTEVMQADFIRFLRIGSIAGRMPFCDAGQMIHYNGIGAEMFDFPLAAEIRAARDTDAFDRIKDDFMRGRDMNFIA